MTSRTMPQEPVAWMIEVVTPHKPLWFTGKFVGDTERSKRAEFTDDPCAAVRYPTEEAARIALHWMQDIRPRRVLGETCYKITEHQWCDTPPSPTQERMREIDQRRLCDRITSVVIEGLHYTDNIEQINKLQTATEVNLAISGGISRYQNDYIFRAKVTTFTARLMDAINEALGGRRE